MPSGAPASSGGPEPDVSSVYWKDKRGRRKEVRLSGAPSSTCLDFPSERNPWEGPRSPPGNAASRQPGPRVRASAWGPQEPGDSDGAAQERGQRGNGVESQPAGATSCRLSATTGPAHLQGWSQQGQRAEGRSPAVLKTCPQRPEAPSPQDPQRAAHLVSSGAISTDVSFIHK